MPIISTYRGVLSYCEDDKLKVHMYLKTISIMQIIKMNYFQTENIQNITKRHLSKFKTAWEINIGSTNKVNHPCIETQPLTSNTRELINF